MTYSVYQHWDPLKVCAVGKNYSPKFYSFINNPRVRNVFEQIAEETEEDYQSLIKLLESFGVEVVRPNLTDNYLDYIDEYTNKIKPPPLCPRDFTLMLGEDFYVNASYEEISVWDQVKGTDWPELPPEDEYENLPKFILDEIAGYGIPKRKFYPLGKDNFEYRIQNERTYADLVAKVRSQGNRIHMAVPKHLAYLNGAEYTRIGRDIYVGTKEYKEDKSEQIAWLTENIPQYRWHYVDTGGHIDGSFCPVKPGLIVSLEEIKVYEKTFPGWEVVYLPNQSWDLVKPFTKLKEKNYGKWWVPGEELNDEFTEYVETWMNHWVGYVEETVFDVNMLVIDQSNVVCNNYNKDVFDAFKRHGVTPHIVNFRHRYFWDSGLHCVTSDIHREGVMQDYFPWRDK